MSAPLCTHSHSSAPLSEPERFDCGLEGFVGFGSQPGSCRYLSRDTYIHTDSVPYFFNMLFFFFSESILYRVLRKRSRRLDKKGQHGARGGTSHLLWPHGIAGSLQGIQLERCLAKLENKSKMKMGRVSHLLSLSQN